MAQQMSVVAGDAIGPHRQIKRLQASSHPRPIGVAIPREFQQEGTILASVRNVLSPNRLHMDVPVGLGMAVFYRI